MRARSLVVAMAMALTSGDLLAFRILESRYHVEVGPDKYIDQLVLLCDDGHTVTIPWQSKLAESCGEDLMGNVTLPAATADAVLADEQQRQTMLAQLRSLYGNISEKQVEFIPGPSGLSTRFKPAMVAVLTSYEDCRRTHKDKAFCAAERDREMAQLANAKLVGPKPIAELTPPNSAVGETTVLAAVEAAMPASSAAPPSKAAAKKASTNAHYTPSKAARAPSTVAAPTPTDAIVPPFTEPAPVASQAAAIPVVPDSVQIARGQTATPAEATQPAQVSLADARASAEQRIADDYTSCMRAKPKLDCEQSRRKSISGLDAAKSAKPAHRDKPAPAAVGAQAAR